MTARNYVVNGFFWTGSDRYRGSYLTAYRNGLYGLYAFDAYHGQFDHSLGSGSPDAGFYIGECFACDAVVDTVISEHNGVGYSGTNSGGDLYIVNSTFRFNRAGIVPNSGSYELCYPGRATTIVGNLVHDNNSTDGPATDSALLAQGNGILLAGGTDTVVERNRVLDHARIGIGAIPYPETDAADVVPPADERDRPCEETRDDELPDPASVPAVVVWPATGNSVVGNVIERSGVADLVSTTLQVGPADPAIEDLGNCFSDNVHETSAPEGLEALAPCAGEGSGGDFSVGAFDVTRLASERPAAPGGDAYRSSPVPAPQASMPGDVEAEPRRFEGPARPDLAAIEVPDLPE
jgi:hypothetical protein